MSVKKSITQRWMVNTLGLILLLLIVLNIGFAYSIKNYYYSGVRQAVISSVDSNFKLIQLYSNDPTKNISSEIRNLVESYSEKDTIELMSIDFNGNITYTSSGFPYMGESNPPDYVQALNSADGKGYHVGKLETGEKYMAVTSLITVTNNQFSALRYMVSLEQVDSLLLKLVLLFIGVSIIIVLFVIISGSFFINSIVRPVREMGVTMRKIAAGDMKVRMRWDSQDELGELCETINYMADELSNSEQLKNEFISSVSHELRTPLTAIQGWSETILSIGVNDTETVKKGMRGISNETERLSDMVEELLDFSRIQNGRFKLVKDKMDILAELEEAVLIYTERAKRDGKQLVYEDMEMLPIIYGDKNRIRQVFINIIDNALKYSDAGDTVTVTAQAVEHKIVVTVEDTGCGIAEKDLPRVKEKFYKANNTRRGSGIGLAVASEIIAMHDGTLTIESQENVGTKVVITLPIDQGTNEQTITDFPPETGGITEKG